MVMSSRFGPGNKNSEGVTGLGPKAYPQPLDV